MRTRMYFTFIICIFILACESSSDDNANNTSNTNNSTNANNTNNSGGFIEEVHPERTVGCTKALEGCFEGYTLIAPLGSTDTWLIDIYGRVVHQWSSQRTPGNVVYLNPDGTLLRTESEGLNVQPVFSAGGVGGWVVLYSWDGEKLWEYNLCDENVCLHHDVERLPSGNILMIAWERLTEAEAIALGRDPETIYDGEVWFEKILEVRPSGASGGTTVWEWRVIDHLIQAHDPSAPNYGDPATDPGRLNLNFDTAMGPSGSPDWLHFNAVSYSEELDQIMISSHNTGELYIIDHATTTQEAASSSGGAQGRGGDFLYRWGNPQVYGTGGADDQLLFVQHDTHWIPTDYPGGGNILIFNNGTRRPGGNFSSVDELSPPLGADGSYAYVSGMAYGPTTFTWSHVATTPSDFYSASISGAQRLPGGTTLICSGTQGTIFEVTPSGEVVWEYINPVTRLGITRQGEDIPTNPQGETTNSIFRAYRYAPDYGAFAGKTLTPGEYIEDQ